MYILHIAARHANAPRHAQVEPKYLTITNYHVIAASDEAVYVWQFRTSFSKVCNRLLPLELHHITPLSPHHHPKPRQAPLHHTHTHTHHHHTHTHTTTITRCCPRMCQGVTRRCVRWKITP